MGEDGDDGTEHDAEELTQDGDRDGDRHGGLGGSIGQARKGSGHDAAQDHIGGTGGADLHQAHGHELDGGTDGKAGGTSPSSRPTSVAPTRGCSKLRRPSRRESHMQNTPTRPTSTALMNVFIPFSFQSGKSLVDYSLASMSTL